MPIKPFESITLDFITDLSPSKDIINRCIFNALLVIIDRYTKDLKYIPCLKTIDTIKLARLFIKFWFKDRGLLAFIITDRGSIFTSRFWSTLCFYLSIKRGLLTAFYPQTDRQTEHQN